MDGNLIKFKALEVKIVPISEIYANDYNPNRMPEAEMLLLMDCIVKYGFLFPILATYDKERNQYRIIDGYHRFEALKRLNSQFAAIIDLELPYHDAVQLTVLMNRIKGMHQVERMSDLVIKLESLGVEDVDICKNLGMEPEEFFRLKQQLGISHIFRNHTYSNSWEKE